MHLRWIPICALLLTTLAQAQEDLSRHAIPRKWIEAVLPENLPALKFPAYYKELQKAKAMAFSGRYKLALLTLGTNNQGDAAEIALVRATCLGALGQHSQALAAVSEPAIADKPRVQIMRARVLAEMGKLKDAMALLKQHVAANPKSILGQFYLGQIAEQAGNTALATEAYSAIHQQTFDRWVNRGADEFNDPEEITAMGQAFDRWATLTGQYKTVQGLHNTIFKLFITVYDLVDASYWPAHLAAAEFALSRDNRNDGLKELKAAFDRNPNHARTRELMCQQALATWNFDEAEKQIAALRRVDPDSISAMLLESRNLMRQRRPRDAMVPVQRTLARQPDHIEALGLSAAIHALLLRDQKADQVLKRIDELAPGCATGYLEVAEALGSMRQYPRAAEKYKVAIERAPWWTDARNGLGLLYTQSGDEDLAQKELEAAKLIDPFNHRTHNYLILLEDLNKMARIETEHFIVRYDAKKDPLIGDYFAHHMEKIHQDVCAAFRHEPPVKTIIEVFPTHDAFSVRTTGSPWIGTVGASTGRVIAMVTPRKGAKTLGTYNWATVLRHEYTHTVTLSATDNRIAHWMTEGLAVRQEQNPMRWEWVPMLYSAVKTNRLFTLEGLTWGFVRPKRPQDRSLAYAQSAWVCDFIAEKFGEPMLIKMMEEFRKGKEQDDVFPRLLGKPLAEFDKEFFAWAAKQVETWGYDAKTTAKYNELSKKAEQLTEARQYAKAIETWEEIRKLRPVDAMPHQRLAGLYLMDGVRNDMKAVEHLLALHKVSLKDNRYAKKIARVYRDTRDYTNAVKYAEQATHIEPYDLEAHELMADIYEKSGNQQALEQQKRTLATLEELIRQWQQERNLEPATQPAASAVE